MKRTLSILLALTLLAVGTGCAPKGGPDGAADKTIKIAVMDSTLVFDSDNSYENGIAMAIEDLNTLYGEQGYEISYEFYDDGAIFQQGMEAINKIASDPEITAVVGTSSLNLLDVSADVLDGAGKLLITYYSSSDSLFENGYTHVFRNCYGESDLGGAIAAYAAVRQDIRRVAVYHSDTEYERGLVRAFLRKTRGTDVEVVDIAATTPLETELDAAIERWEKLGVDTVLVSQYLAEDSFEILRKVREMDPEMNILGDFSFDYTDDLLANGDVSDNIYIAGPLAVDESPELDEFYRRYEQRYGSRPTQWAVQLYDSIRMVADTAVRAGSTSPTAIAEALREQGGYTGVGGTIAFDGKGRLTGRTPRIMVSRDGMFSFIQEGGR